MEIGTVKEERGIRSGLEVADGESCICILLGDRAGWLLTQVDRYAHCDPGTFRPCADGKVIPLFSRKDGCGTSAVRGIPIDLTGD